MKKVIVMQGLPGSGKTTWAKELVSKNPGEYKRVNKDDLRAMLDCSHWSKHNEKFVVSLRDHIVIKALEDGKHVIVDDTNLAGVTAHSKGKHYRHLKQLIRGQAQVQAEVQVKSFLDVSLKECIVRDLTRLNSVGEKVIRSMYNGLEKPEIPKIEYDTEKVDAIICDLDGTLSLLNGRNPYDGSKCNEDLLNEPVANILKNYFDKAHRVILLSGRSVEFKNQTRQFLEKYEVMYHSLIMRELDDSRDDRIVKREMFDKYVRRLYNVEFVLDDRNKVVDMWRELGLTCLQVAPGDF